jgi:hypothetical protein
VRQLLGSAGPDPITSVIVFIEEKERIKKEDKFTLS